MRWVLIPLLLVVMLLPGASDSRPLRSSGGLPFAPSPCNDSPPAGAISAGYTHESLCTGPNNIPTTDDTNSTNPGFTFYWNNGGAPPNCTGSTSAYSVDHTTGVVTVVAPFANPNACLQLETMPGNISTGALFPIIGHMLAGGYYVTGTITYNQGSPTSADRGWFGGVTPQVSNGWEIDDPDIVGNTRQIPRWIGMSTINQTVTGSPDPGGTSETNHAFGILATPTATTFWDNNVQTGTVSYLAGSAAQLVGQYQSLGFGGGHSWPGPMQMANLQIWTQPFASNEHAFGDDIGVNNTPTWPTVVQTNEGLASLTNNSANGATTCSASQGQVFPNENPQSSNNPIYTMQLGSNDAQNAVGQTNFDLCMEAMLTWLGVPQSSKTFASACTKSGSWVADNVNVASGIAEASSHTGDTLTCTITGGPADGQDLAGNPGGAIYLWYRRCPTCGNFTYAVGGGGPTSVTGSTTTSGGDFGVVRLTQATYGTSYTITFTLTGGGSGGSNTIVGIGVPSGTNCCRVVAGGIIHQFVNGTSCNNDSVTGTYDGYLQALIEVLQARDALAVGYAQTRFYVNNTTDMVGASNCLLPNPTGQTHIAQAFANIWP
jgi:hypothetical protein